jgi:predicted dehydrogenase
LSYTAAVIGLGQIGQGYDYNCIDSSLAITHASGFHNHSSFELIGGVDPNVDRCKEFKRKYDKPASTSLATLMTREKIDVVSIAVPTHLHYEIFNEIISYSPRAIICEKPIAESFPKAEEMVAKAEERNSALLVNYIRRFEPGTNMLRQKIINGNFGEIYKGTIWYSKGLYNNGSHFIDLLLYFFGEVTKIKVINKGRYWKKDPEPDFIIKFGDVKVVFLAGREEYYSISEMELFGTKGKANYLNGGNQIKYQLTKPDPIYSGYTVLDDNAKLIKTDFDRYQMYVLDNLVDHLENNEPLKSDGSSAFKTLKIVENIKHEIEVI